MVLTQPGSTALRWSTIVAWMASTSLRGMLHEHQYGGFSVNPGKGSARPHKIIAQSKRDTNVHISTFAVLCRCRANVDLIVSLEIAQRTQTTVIQCSRCGRSDAIDSVE